VKKLKKKLNVLYKNFSWTFSGNIVYALSQWGIIVLLAKIGTVEMVGQFSLGLALSAPIILFFNLQLNSIVATDTSNQNSFGVYFGSRIVYLMLAIIFIVLITTISNYDQELTWIIILVGLSKVFESLSELTHGYMQKIERMDFVGKSQMIKGVISLLTVYLCLLLTQSLIISLISLILVWFLRLVSYDLRNLRKFTAIRPIFNSEMRQLFVFALPLGIVSLLNSLNSNIPRYFLENYVGIEELGYYAAIVYMLVAGNLLIKPLSLVVAPRLANYYNSNNFKSFLKLNFLLLLISLIIGLILITIVIFMGEWILKIVYGPNYIEYHLVFIIVMIGSTLSFFTTFLNISIVAARAFKIQPFVNVITTIVTIISSFLIIPSQGVTGAALVLIITFSTQFFGSLLIFIYILYFQEKPGEKDAKITNKK